MVFEYADIAQKIGVDKEKVPEYKEAINEFVKYVFKFDGNYHVRSSYQEKTPNDASREEVSPEALANSPSLDVFERLARYKEQHNSALKKEVNNLYAIRPGFEYAIQIYGVFDSDKASDDFKDTNGPSLSVDMYKGLTNKWILIESTEENADKTKYYSKDNEILENMIHQMKKDQEIGHKMIEKRRKDAVKQNSATITEEEKD